MVPFILTRRTQSARSFLPPLLSRGVRGEHHSCRTSSQTKPSTPITSDTTTPGTNTRTVLSPLGTRFESPPRVRFAPRGGLGGATLAAPAQAAEVVSSNIVGYNKITLTDKLTMVASQFNNVGTGAKDIQELFSANDLPGIDESYQFQTILQVWSGSAYTTYGWSADGDGDLLGDASLNGKWLDENYAVATEDMSTGKAYWIETATEGTIVESGEVDEGNTKEISVSAGLTMLANPFPVKTSIQKIVPSANIPGIDESYQFQTILQVWSGSAYTTYGWSADGDGDLLGDASLNGKWLDENYAAVSDEIDIGQGFWFETPGSGTLTFSK